MRQQHLLLWRPDLVPDAVAYWTRVLQWQKEVSYGSATPANNRVASACEVSLDPVGRRNDGWFYASGDESVQQQLLHTDVRSTTT